jgi:DNA-binding CsgD family transcriptional regulator
LTSPAAALTRPGGLISLRRERDVVAANDPLLERHDQLERIEAALTEARAGRGTFVVIEGPAGIGKTALLAATRAVAAESGMRVLRSRGAELERDFAFGVVRQLFEPALSEASEAERDELLHGGARVAAELLSFPGALAAEPPSPCVDPSFVILHGLYWLCANLAARGPVCVVVDDAHWADAPSLRYLAFLVTRLHELGIALVLATRPQGTGTDAELLATLATDPSTDLIRLPPLTRAGVAQLVESRLGREPHPVFVDACLRATRGMPFLMRELVEALTEGGIAPTAEAARHVEEIGAHTVGRSTRLRLRLLPKHAALLARALAILEQSDLHQAARLAGLDDVEAADAAELLAAAGILKSDRPLTFIHPIVRSGLYSELTGAERAQGHRRAARLLAEQAGANERVAKHLLMSEPAADDWVVERLAEAARGAVRNGAPESAALFLRRALDEPPPPDDQSGLLLELGMVEANAGLDDEWPEHLRLAVEAAPNAAAAAGTARGLARALNNNQRHAEAVEVLDRAASALDSRHAELALRLEAAAVIAGMNDPATAPSVAARRAALRTRVGADHEAPPDVLAVAAFISVLSNEPAEVGAELATRALVAGDDTPEDLPGRAWFSSATFARTTLALLWTERYAQLRPLIDASIAHSRVSGDGGRLSLGLGTRGWAALRQGDLFAAEIETRTALSVTELPAPPMYRVLNGGILVKALVDQGELDAAEKELESFEPEIETGFLTTGVLRLARGRLRFKQGRVTEALEDFRSVGVGLTRATITCPGFLPWRSEAALAHLALGDQQSAERLAEEELELARAFGAPRVLGVASRAAGVVTGGDRGETLLREAVDSLARGEARVDRAQALADLGAMLRRRNRRTEARELLREALDVAHRAGAALIADQAETELRATGARPRRAVLTGLDSLTASERRIAEYAGQGLTNREIAQTLFVTSRTVEGHLTSIFRKLQLDSRADLAAALAAG